MSVLISDDEKAAFRSALIGLFASVPLDQRLMTLSGLVNDCYQLHYSSNTKLYTKPQAAAFQHAVEQWLLGENPYRIDFHESLKLSATAKKEIKRLLKTTKIKEFSADQVLENDSFETNCSLSVGKWSGSVKYEYSYNREHNYAAIYKDAKITDSVHSWEDLHISVGTSLNLNNFLWFFSLAAFDLLHRGAQQDYNRRPYDNRCQAFFYPMS